MNRIVNGRNGHEIYKRNKEESLKRKKKGKSNRGIKIKSV